MKLSIANMQSDLTWGQRFDLQRSMFTEFKQFFFSFGFSFITSDLLGLGRWFWLFVFLASKRFEWYPFWPQKVILKIWPEVKVRSGQTEPYEISYDSERWDKHIDATFTRLCHPVQELCAKTCFFHRLIMGEVKNWPVIVSRNWKIRDINFVGNHVRIWSWKFQVIRTKTVSLARP